MSKLIFLLLLFTASKEITTQVTYPYICDPNNRPSVCTMEYYYNYLYFNYINKFIFIIKIHIYVYNLVISNFC